MAMNLFRALSVLHQVDIDVGEDIMGANKRLAGKNRKVLKGHGVVSLNIMGAIGSGKTILIEKAVENLPDLRCGAIVGDIRSDLDAGRLEKHGIPVVGMNTGKECHLDAHLVEHGLDKLPLADLDVVFVENVGNLICPSDFALGTDARVVVVSTSEGDDIVEKHPMIFHDADLAIVNKVDIAEHVGADADKMEADALKINPGLKVIKTSAKTGEGLEEWYGFIRGLPHCTTN